MALWPFGKKNASTPEQHAQEQEEHYNDVPSQVEPDQTSPAATPDAGDDRPDPIHDAVTGTTGVTPHGRITPVAFAGRTSAGQWREATREIADGMRKDGLTVRVEQGPWGREVVGEANDRLIRIAGVDGPRWMLRMTMISPADRADAMRELGHEVIARTFVNRGDAPILAGSPLPVALPQQFADQIQQAMAKRAQQQKQNAQPTNQPGATGDTGNAGQAG